MNFFEGKYTYKTVAERYGVSETTVQVWAKKGWLKKRKLGGRTYFTPEDLNEFERREANDGRTCENVSGSACSCR